MTDTRNIKYLVFAGGGTAGYAFGGALEQLGEQKDFSFDRIEAAAGTSVGAIAALLVCLKYTPHQMKSKFESIDFSSFKDGGYAVSQYYRLFTEYGMHKGDAILAIVLNIIKEKTGRDDPEKVTFTDLKTMGFKDLYIVATKIYKADNVPTGKQKIFSYEDTPNTAVATAIRASTAAPVFFTRVRLKKTAQGKYEFDSNGNIFSDGGLINNYPIDIFDKPKFVGLPEKTTTKINNPHTLGLMLLTMKHYHDVTHVPVKAIIPDNQPYTYSEGIFNTLLHQFEKQRLNKQRHAARTIKIDRKGVELSEFDLTPSKKEELYQAGKKAVQEYFSHTHQNEESVDNRQFTGHKT